MQCETDHKNHLAKIDNKLAFLKKAQSYNLSLEQKEWLQTNADLFTKLLQALQNNQKQTEYEAQISEDIYNRLTEIKRKVLSWLKFKSTDLESFKNLYKEKGKELVLILEQVSLPPRISEFKIEDLKRLTFPSMSYTNEELCQFSKMMFTEQNILAELNISKEKLGKIIQKICEGYNVVAYHNFTHGFNVLQVFYAILKTTELEQVLDKIEVFATLFAALGHDLGHKGYNNAYEVQVRSRNSLAYFDSAPLENMHAATLIKILKDPDNNLFDHLSDTNQKTRFKDLATTIILGTDMAKHHERIEKFRENVKFTLEYRKLKAENQPIEAHIEDKALIMEKACHRKRVLRNVIHACDVSTPCQKYENYSCWAAAIAQEFDNQYKKETKKGIQVTNYLMYKNNPSYYDGQVYFIKTFVAPIWEQISLLLGGVAVEAVSNLNDNSKLIEQEKEKVKALED